MCQLAVSSQVCLQASVPCWSLQRPLPQQWPLSFRRSSRGDSLWLCPRAGPPVLPSSTHPCNCPGYASPLGLKGEKGGRWPQPSPSPAGGGWRVAWDGCDTRRTAHSLTLLSGEPPVQAYDSQCLNFRIQLLFALALFCEDGAIAFEGQEAAAIPMSPAVPRIQ